MAEDFASQTTGVEPTLSTAGGDDPAASAKPAGGFGAQLRAAREAQGISLGDMAVRSRLSVAQVRALEDEDVSALPEPVYVRAFIRGCAHSLGLDPQALAEDYMNRYGRGGSAAELGQIPKHDPSREQVINAVPRHRGLKAALLVVLIGLVSAGIWAIYTDQFAGVHSGSEAQKIESGVTEAAPAPAAQPAASAAPAEKSAAEKPAEAPVQTTAPAAAQSAAAAQTAAPAAAPAAAQPAPAEQSAQNAQNAQNAQAAPAAQTARPVAAAAANHRVEFRLSGACWVQVIAPSGRNVVAREMQPGANEVLEIPRGSRFTIGNADAMQLMVDGRAYALTDTVRNGVARFTLQ